MHPHSLVPRPAALPVAHARGAGRGRLGPHANVTRYLSGLGAGYAAKTRSCLESDWACFCRWCAAKGLAPYPTPPETVVAYLAANSGGHSLATLKRRLATLSHLHDALGDSNPTRHPAVRLALRGLARAKGTRPLQRRAPLRQGDVEKILAALDDSLRACRDRALLLTARDTLARRAELARLTCEDLDWRATGEACALLRQTKDDPYGRTAWLAPQTAGALKDWLTRAKIAEGPVFRQVIGHRQVGDGLRPQGLARRLKTMAGAAGFDPARIGGHSTRLGMACDLVADGASLVAVQLAGGWSDPAMVSRYAADLLPELGAVARFHRGRAPGGTRSPVATGG